MRIVAFGFGCALFGIVTFAQTGATNVDLRSLLGGGSTTAPLTIGERVQAESDALAASSNAALAEAQSQYLRYRSEEKNEDDARGRATAARRRLSDLSLERDRDLDEMRRGFFCRACHRTRSQVEASGENWQAHLNANSEGRAVGATPEELKAKEREFEGKINSAKAEEYQATQAAAASARAQADAAQHVMNSFGRWKQAMLVEDDGRAKAWDSAINNFKERFDADQKGLESLNSAIARDRAAELRTKRVEDLQTLKEQYQASLRSMVDEAQQAYFSRKMQEALFEQRLDSGRKELESFVQAVGAPPLAVISSFGSTPSASGKLNVPGTPFSFSGDDALGMMGGLGKFKASLRLSEDWLRNKLHVDVMLGIDTPYGPLEGGIRQTTEYGPDGVTITVSPRGNAPKPPTPPDPLDDLLKTKKGNKVP